ncbi:ras and Rab interactor 1-like isoform X2 [Heteronotia binoei]|nr:ras and Rab interactor 1-like isoform X2 [Heteronotia binoei]XP_060108180.1 ras and Rab interactor 1-like isoform X2 [Heteronotia binoei]
MTQNPIYDYPNPHTSPQQEVQTSPRNISLMGRLRFTQPIWLQIDINSATALHILHREPPGTFLVRRSNMRQCMVLCLRLPDNSSSGFVTTYCLHREPTVISLEGSDMKFPSLLHLVASYCSTPDILPLPLRLPHAIRKASSNHQLEAIAHLELEFWSSSFNTREPVQPAPLVPPVDVGIDPLPLSLHNPEGENCKQLV